MATYALNLDCSFAVTNGNLQPYNYNGGNPTGVVWWTSDAGSQFTPLPCTSQPDNDGNPACVSPQLNGGDSFWVAVRDTTAGSEGWTVQDVSISVVFSRFTRANQAPIASPFQATDNTGTVYDVTVIENAYQQDNVWWRTVTANASFPSSGTSTVSFEFAVGVVVTYTNGTLTIVRHFGIDPEMDAENYG